MVEPPTATGLIVLPTVEPLDIKVRNARVSPHSANVSTDAIWWAIAFILANVIPGFSNLLALLGALVGWSIVIGLPSLMYLRMEWNPVRSAGIGGQGKMLWRSSIRQSYLQNWKASFWFYLCACLLVIWPVAVSTCTLHLLVLSRRLTCAQRR